ncbi:MAG: L,D-transpeptidase family protein [Mobilitalea sp.]
MTRNLLDKSSKKMRGNKKKKWIYVVSAILVILLLILLTEYLFISLYYENRFYKNTVINGVDVSNMTVEQVEDTINEKVAAYSLTLEERNDVTEQINGYEINLHTVYDSSLTDLLKAQNKYAWFKSLYQDNNLDIDTSFEYDDYLLDKYFDALECVDETKTVEPANATTSAYGVNGYEIVPEVAGTKIKVEVLYEAVKNSIISLESTLSLEKIECYVAPEVTAENPDLVAAVTEMNRIASAKITYEFGDAVEIVDGSRISEWLSVDEYFQVFLNEESIKDFVDYIGKTYNTFGKERTFTTSYGDILQIKGGDYGWWLNRPQEVTELKELILAGAQQVKEPTYFQTAQQYGDDDIGNTYVEINLTAQHLFFYKEGKLIIETDVVTGNVAKKYGTPVGTYPIQYKEEDATLVGEDYSSPVKYWMPFNKNIGLHDATWREEFGKDIYLTNGSHGCINMPPAAAKKVFADIKRGVAVVVYKLKGTENYEVKDSKAAKSKSTVTE